MSFALENISYVVVECRWNKHTQTTQWVRFILTYLFCSLIQMHAIKFTHVCIVVCCWSYVYIYLSLCLSLLFWLECQRFNLTYANRDGASNRWKDFGSFQISFFLLLQVEGFILQFHDFHCKKVIWWKKRMEKSRLWRNMFCWLRFRSPCFIICSPEFEKFHIPIRNLAESKTTGLPLIYWSIHFEEKIKKLFIFLVCSHILFDKNMLKM